MVRLADGMVHLVAAVVEGWHGAVMAQGCGVGWVLQTLSRYGWSSYRAGAAHHRAALKTRACACLRTLPTPTSQSTTTQRCTAHRMSAPISPLLMESNVHLPCAASWSADLHRRTCKSEFVWT
jgi:hypothetical protein